MKFILITWIFLISFSIIVAVPAKPKWADDVSLEKSIENPKLSTLSTTLHPTDVPTPPQEGCPIGNGSVPVGTTYNEGECKHCRCIEPGKPQCFTLQCPKPKCVDSVYIKGKCCPVCLNGYNCRMEDGSILPHGKQIQFESMTCECVNIEDNWEEPAAKCT